MWAGRVLMHQSHPAGDRLVKIPGRVDIFVTLLVWFIWSRMQAARAFRQYIDLSDPAISLVAFLLRAVYHCILQKALTSTCLAY